MITNASASTNFGSAAQVMLGTGVGCGGVNVVDACRMMVGVDLGKCRCRPRPCAHGGLELYLPVNGGAVQGVPVTLTVHEVLNPSVWGEASSTWNESSPGNAWPLLVLPRASTTDPPCPR